MKTGILLFCVVYGLIEVFNANFLYKKNKLKNLDALIISIWGLLLSSVGIIEILGDTTFWLDISYFLFGISWIIMIRTPCSARIFHKKENPNGPLARKIIFIFLALSQFATIVLRHI